MKCVIAGSRDLGSEFVNERWTQLPLEDCPFVEEAFTLCDWHDKITEIVSGQARGIDNLGEQLADKLGLSKGIFPADWKTYGRRAGPIRNGNMADYADVAIVIMKEGGSTGSRDMIRQMERRDKPVAVFEIKGGKLCRAK